MYLPFCLSFCLPLVSVLLCLSYMFPFSVYLFFYPISPIFAHLSILSPCPSFSVAPFTYIASLFSHNPFSTSLLCCLFSFDLLCLSVPSMSILLCLSFFLSPLCLPFSMCLPFLSPHFPHFFPPFLFLYTLFVSPYLSLLFHLPFCVSLLCLTFSTSPFLSLLLYHSSSISPSLSFLLSLPFYTSLSLSILLYLPFSIFLALSLLLCLSFSI